jgi:hypothetical protein
MTRHAHARARTGVRVLCAAVAVAAIATPAFAGPRAVHRITLRSVPASSTQTGNTLFGVYSGTLGPCAMTGTLVLPDTTQTLTCRGGTFVLSATATVLASNISGKFSVAQGTGRFRGITGKGTWKGITFATNLTYTGSLKY